MSKEHEKVALAHIDFLIEPITREDLGITSRDLGTQVLRLCGGFNDLQAELKKSPWIKITPETLSKIPIRTKLLTARMYKEPLELEDGFNCPCAVAIILEDEKWYTAGNKSGEYKPTHYQPITLPEKG